MSSDAESTISIPYVYLPMLLPLMFMWQATVQIYWLVVVYKTSWNDYIRELSPVITSFSVSIICNAASTILDFYGFPLSAGVAKILPPFFLCACLFLTLNIAESHMAEMSTAHRWCYRLLVENCEGFSLTWSHAETTSTVSTILVRHFNAGLDTVVAIHRTQLAVCVIFMYSVELIFYSIFRWVVASHIPILLWAFTMHNLSMIGDVTVWLLVVASGLFVSNKVVAMTCNIKEQDKSTEILNPFWHVKII
ncbi:Hypp3763 [Branchiostoma lanceolatum]|uniref:Hypp3763 protein n=1 Tax=Branchiostoma lanceolatum TaxID=7740 RepID=A0A8K0A3R2_BRALA|nr:Hypp3763 [Branchiostoma lanceolatum]